MNSTARLMHHGSNVGAVMDHCALHHNGPAEPEVNLCSNPQLWSSALGSGQKNEIEVTSGWNDFPP